MKEILKVEKLNKTYPKFSLKDVSFSINSGEIMGFVGRNGAGKTTTLKSVMNLLHVDSGTVVAFGKDMKMFELENKQKIGFALSEINYYPNRTIRQMADVTKRFYKNFSEETFAKACSLFKLDPSKKLDELSSGMKVKYSVAIALSHDAQLLILDEPTSGLDPLSRDEILDIFRELVKKKDRAILFSTHITSDLDKCATHITYIHDGSIKFTGTKKDFLNTYLFVKDKINDSKLLDKFISYKDIDGVIEGLILSKDKKEYETKGIKTSNPDLDQVLIYLERSTDYEKFTL